MNRPLEFCAHLARAVRHGRKTTTWKPLSPADIERRVNGFTSTDIPFPIGSISGIYEPWGLIGGDAVYTSSFVADVQGGEYTTPAGFRPMTGMRNDVAVKITGCALRQLSTITNDEAEAAGMVPPDGSQNYRAEFERQWRGAYRGPQAWEADPLCWLISFTLEA